MVIRLRLMLFVVGAAASCVDMGKCVNGESWDGAHEVLLLQTDVRVAKHYGRTPLIKSDLKKTSSARRASQDIGGNNRLAGRKQNVPAILHQTGTAKEFEENEKYVDSWRKLNISHRKYSDEDLALVVNETVPHLFQSWLDMVEPIERIDFWRYAVMFRYGGVYADVDMELTQPSVMQKFMDLGKVVLAHDQGGDLRTDQLGQSLLISPPGVQFWMDLMNHLASNYNSSCAVVQNTGPLAITKFWITNQGCSSYPDVHLTQQMNTRSVNANSHVVVHHSTGSWLWNILDGEGARQMSCAARFPTCDEWCSSRSSCSLPFID